MKKSAFVIGLGGALMVPNPSWTLVQQGDCDSIYARWRYYDGSKQLQNIASGACLEADGRLMSVRKCDRDVANQRGWEVARSPEPGLGTLAKTYSSSSNYRLLTGWESSDSVSLEVSSTVAGTKKHLWWLDS